MSRRILDWAADVTFGDLSLLTGIPIGEVLEEIERQGIDIDTVPDGGSVPFTIPADWLRAGRRRRAEFAAATGSDSLPFALEWWGDREGEQLGLYGTPGEDTIP